MVATYGTVRDTESLAGRSLPVRSVVLRMGVATRAYHSHVVSSCRVLRTIARSAPSATHGERDSARGCVQHTFTRHSRKRTCMC